MKTIKPDYFDNFKCKADKCIDSCCSAGWQIQVDNNSITKYCNLKDEFFANINNFLQTEKNIKTFKQQKGNCLFLKDGLCSLVTKYGDKYLCDVCRDYPRFYNYIGDVSVVGLSLDCEEVANLVLNNKNPVKFVSNNAKSKDKQLQQKIDLMFKLIGILQDRSCCINDRIVNVLKLFNIKEFCIDKSIFDCLDKLEWLNFDGNKLSKFLSDKNFSFDFKYDDIAIENLLVYFVYRYFVSKAKKFSDLTKFKFALFCTICCDKMQDFFDKNSKNYYQYKSVTTFCRQIEYSTINVNLLMQFFDKN